jgi:hypothetical protein
MWRVFLKAEKRVKLYIVIKDETSTEESTAKIDVYIYRFSTD